MMYELRRAIQEERNQISKLPKPETLTREIFEGLTSNDVLYINVMPEKERVKFNEGITRSNHMLASVNEIDQFLEQDFSELVEIKDSGNVILIQARTIRGRANYFLSRNE